MLRLTTSRATENGRLYANNCLIDQSQKVAPSVQALGAFLLPVGNGQNHDIH
jgi:hypothetical protein